MSALQAYRDAMRDWSALTPAERKRRAARAVAERDHETLWELTRAHLMFKGRKGSSVSVHTLKAYRLAVVELLEYWRGVDLLRPGVERAQEYVRRLEEGVPEPGTPGTFAVAPKSPSTVNQRVAAIRHLYEALEWCGLEVPNPFAKLAIRKDPTPAHEKRSEYSLDILEALLAQAQADDDGVSRVALLLGATSGLRVSEIVGLRWSDIDWTEGFITVRGKGDKTRIVPMSAELSRELSGLPRQGDWVLTRRYRGVGPFTTEAIRRRLDRLCIRAFGKNPETGRGVAYKGVHSLRHTFGVFMYEELGLLDTQAMMGHADVSTTATYSKVTSRKASERAKAAQAKLERLTRRKR